jgi:transposase
MTVRRHEVTSAQWRQLQPLLAELVPRKPKTGRPNADHRRILNGIVWKLRTGAPWRDLPERYGPWSTVYSRFWRWQRAGIWDRLFAAVQRQEDAAGHLDWTLHFVDGSVIRAHQHAAGAKGGTPALKHSATARAAFRPRCISRPRATASR